MAYDFRPRSCHTCGLSYKPTSGNQRLCPTCVPHDTARYQMKLAALKADAAAYEAYLETQKERQRASRIRNGHNVRDLDRSCAICGKAISREVHLNVKTCGAACRGQSERLREKARRQRRRNKAADEDRAFRALPAVADTQQERQRVLLGGCLGCAHSQMEEGRARCALKRLLACDPNGPKGPKLKEAI